MINERPPIDGSWNTLEEEEATVEELEERYFTEEVNDESTE